jgi:hypothetical protein
MHRLITGAPAGVEVDHRNGNGLDNRRSNLRLATTSQNQGNQRLSRANTSGFKGVHWDKHRAKWKASIAGDNNDKHLGHFTDPSEAAHAYDSAARLRFGRFASVNFPQLGERGVSP